MKAIRKESKHIRRSKNVKDKTNDGRRMRSSWEPLGLASSPRATEFERSGSGSLALDPHPNVLPLTIDEPQEAGAPKFRYAAPLYGRIPSFEQAEKEMKAAENRADKEAKRGREASSELLPGGDTRRRVNFVTPLRNPPVFSSLSSYLLETSQKQTSSCESDLYRPRTPPSSTLEPTSPDFIAAALRTIRERSRERSRDRLQQPPNSNHPDTHSTSSATSLTLYHQSISQEQPGRYSPERLVGRSLKGTYRIR